MKHDTGILPVDVDNYTFEATPRTSIHKSIVFSEPSTPVPVAGEGATRPEIARLFKHLDLNVTVHLTKTDTFNLLQTLLTCNEMQLKVLQTNKRIPVSVKTIIKRILDDSLTGNTDMIERLWDRVFGKTPLASNEETSSTINSILGHNKPVSRETYMIIREKLIGQ